ncbi:MAG TPA: hypothetical protein VND89_05995 [Acidimicrobiales bacterium]|nr:hypothetical protein [Acidimicrobiales bacterium]
MTTVGVLIAAVALLLLVFYWSGRYGDRNRKTGTSLRRGPHAHTTARGQPKKSYESRDAAEAGARLMIKRGGEKMSVYKCGTCAKWHIGH